jgi:hypothetical protein
VRFRAEHQRYLQKPPPTAETVTAAGAPVRNEAA